MPRDEIRHSSIPHTLDTVAASLAAGSPDGLRRFADTVDEARYALSEVAARLERTLAGVEAVWPSGGPDPLAGHEQVRRTQQLLHAIDNAAYGQSLRTAADSLAAVTSRVNDLRAQRSASPSSAYRYDEQASATLRGLADVYRELGISLGGETSPRPPVDSPVTLAATGSEAVDLFRPVSPAVATALQTKDPAAVPSTGSPAGGGFPMAPMMPMGGMSGMSGGGTQYENTRRGSAIQGDPRIWGDADGGWNVLGRSERVEMVRREQTKTKGESHDR
ncbi:hypothetical protein [Micromonospora chokoriensis]